MNPLRERLGALTGLRPDLASLGKLASLSEWLVAEAIPQGGLGPNEATEVLDRHLLGSAAFSIGFSQPPSICWDLGSGAGLPGLVLALLWPTTRMVLIDRSQKRCDLVRRAARIIEVDVQIDNRDFADLAGGTGAIVSRAAMPPAGILPILERLLTPGGVAVISGSQQKAPPPYIAITIPKGVLDPPPRLLMMRQQ